MSESNNPPKHHVPVEVSGSIWFRSGEQSWGNPRRMSLLAAINEEGSITAAAKKIKLSYKAAWDAVDTMNNLAGEALVTRTTGGQRGGGASLTPRALELLQLYQALSQEHERFMGQLARANNLSLDNLELIQHMMVQTSARNKLAGVIEQIKPGAVNDEIILAASGNLRITASITKESVETLELRPGKRVLAFIKASSVIVGLPDQQQKLSASNQLKGRISRINPGTVNSEVSLTLDSGQVIAAMVNTTGMQSLRLEEEQVAYAIFNASSVMLGTLD